MSAPTTMIKGAPGPQPSRVRARSQRPDPASAFELKTPSAAPTSLITEGEVSDDDFDTPIKPFSPHLTLSQFPVSMQRQLLARAPASGCELKRHASAAKSHGWEDYSLRIVTAGAVTTNGSGVVQQVFAADPTVLSLAEWATFAALFDEVKLESFDLKVSTYSGASPPAVTSIAMGSFLNKGALPSTILSVLLAPDGHLICPNMVTPQGCHLVAPPLLFAPTTTPAGTTAYGCPGYIHLYATGPNSTAIMTYMVTARYHLRGRM